MVCSVLEIFSCQQSYLLKAVIARSFLKMQSTSCTLRVTVFDRCRRFLYVIEVFEEGFRLPGSLLFFYC
jgi:hypothetical protein